MKAAIENHVTATWSVLHPFSKEDQAAMAAMRAIIEPNKGRLQGTAARIPFDAIMERVDKRGRVLGFSIMQVSRLSVPDLSIEG